MNEPSRKRNFIYRELAITLSHNPPSHLHIYTHYTPSHKLKHHRANTSTLGQRDFAKVQVGSSDHLLSVCLFFRPTFCFSQYTIKVCENTLLVNILFTWNHLFKLN